ncbi:methyl-accepting chemotaxis protein [Rhizobium hainanense]|uniref:Methyl-accepting chemotaxis protein (MCP) signalling domain-containing protein n=1 Tax=Rhizobium hainanense TaxID=52131 RepID=A0A1C3W844_9HYPH|nr:methyl-accepting chemotaxis protein [Rhizobium hainanense]SCB36229.1 Methyl-accepting chemotaxis protein (MCP) signalling domain-containing protein [Rhizobium hainanense]
MFSRSKAKEETETYRRAQIHAEFRCEAMAANCGVPVFEAVLSSPSLSDVANTWSWPEDIAQRYGFSANATPDGLADKIKNGRLLYRKLQEFIANKDELRFTAFFHFLLPGAESKKFRMAAGKAVSSEGVVHLFGSLFDLSAPVELDADEQRMNEVEQNGILGMARSLAALAQGDLGQRVTVEFHPKAARLKTDLNTALEKLDMVMQAVTLSGMNIRHGSNEISSAINDLARRTENSAATLEETSAAVSEIDMRLRTTAASSKEVSGIIGLVQDKTFKSGAVATRAVNAMSKIEQSSRQIGDILGVIDNIAFQTNLLALNAGVEAARAGDAGKGFAVVAQEVRELAQRSAGAAKEIKALIAESAAQVDEGVSLVQQTGEAFRAITEEFTGIGTYIAEITSNVSEQSHGLAQISASIRQMDLVTQQNAAMVEELSAASTSLSNEARSLSEKASVFKVSDQRASAESAQAA